MAEVSGSNTEEEDIVRVQDSGGRTIQSEKFDLVSVVQESSIQEEDSVRKKSADVNIVNESYTSDSYCEWVYPFSERTQGYNLVEKTQSSVEETVIVAMDECNEHASGKTDLYNRSVDEEPPPTYESVIFLCENPEISFDSLKPEATDDLSDDSEFSKLTETINSTLQLKFGKGNVHSLESAFVLSDIGENNSIERTDMLSLQSGVLSEEGKISSVSGTIQNKLVEVVEKTGVNLTNLEDDNLPKETCFKIKENNNSLKETKLSKALEGSKSESSIGIVENGKHIKNNECETQIHSSKALEGDDPTRINFKGESFNEKCLLSLKTSAEKINSDNNNNSAVASLSRVPAVNVKELNVSLEKHDDAIVTENKETPPKRKTSIFIKKHEKEGRSRSPSPLPKRYRKVSDQMQKSTLLKELKLSDGNYETSPELLPKHSKAPVNVQDFKEPVVVTNNYQFSAKNNSLIDQNNFIFEDEDDEILENVGLLENYKYWPTQRGLKKRTISGGSTSEDEIPSVHKKIVETNVKGKRLMYELISGQKRTMSNSSCDDDDDFGSKTSMKSRSKLPTGLDGNLNNTISTSQTLRRRTSSTSSFRSCFGLDKRRSSSSESDSEEYNAAGANKKPVKTITTQLLKLSEKDAFNKDFIERFIKSIRIPPMRQRSVSGGDEKTLPKDVPNMSKSQRSRSLGQPTVPLVTRKTSVVTEPWKGAWDYTFLKIVEPTDTLASVAAHFDITPSELAILNRLPSSRTVFPGQVIRVPDKRRREAGADASEDKENQQVNPEQPADDKSEVCDDEMDMLEKLRLTSPKPGHAERVRTPLSPTPDPTPQRFLKINVRHITDGQGVVSGVLLVTSNAVMFDPNVSDPLVIEHGPESYGVIAPMEYVVNVAIYHDIAHMRVGSHDQFRPDWPKPEVYYLKEAEETEGEGSSGTLLTTNQGDSLDSGDPHHSPSAREDSLLAKDETFPELRSSTEDEEEENGSMCSCSVPREGDAFPKAFERELVTPTNLATPNEKQESEADGPTPKLEGVAMMRSLEERRKSSLDHHWAVPSKVRSLEEQSTSQSDNQEMDNNRRNSEGLLVKLSCHDSGIDIRDPPPVVLPMAHKNNFSDADVLLGDGFVPPVPIKPLRPDEDADSRRKKNSSVSFSLDDMKETDEDVVPLRERDDAEKETKKNKMMKRLSYPLSWMEGLSGDKEEKESSLPSSAESPHPSSHSSSSVFSKVFSSSPINMVTDFSSGLFMKTPSEEGGRFPFPPTPNPSVPPSEPPPTPASADSTKPQGLASFSPSNIITSVGRSSVGTFIRQQHANPAKESKDKAAGGPKLDYRSMVSVEDMPELFVSFDIHAPLFPQLEGLELIPRPAQSCDDPPLYLRLRMGKPKDKKIPKSTPIMSYGKKKMRPEYWFSVPRERVDDLYRFLMLWVPHLYGDLNESTVADRGYELVDSDTELWETEDGAKQDGRRDSDDDLGELTRESWEVLKAPYCKLYTILKTQADQMGSTESGDEVLSMSEELRRALYASNATSLDLELCVPDLNGATEILSEEHRKQLCRHLPARAEGYVWTLVFSTSQHGFSLNSMYRKMTRIESPILMVIQDTENNVFGALTSCALKMSDHFYGTGESLLFRFTNDSSVQVYNWTGDNMYFIKGNNESLSIGAGDGKFGLWLDGDLYQGRTEPCNTYGNDPLTPSQDFVVKTLECWAFI